MSTTEFESEAKLYLENLQEQVYSYFNTNIISQEEKNNSLDLDDEFYIGWLKSRNEPYDKEAITALRIKWETIRKENQRNKPTKFENADWHYLLRDIVKEFEEVFHILDYKPPEYYLFGTLPTNRVNGMAMAIPDNPYKLIILETGLFGFANLMCKVIASAFIFKDSENGMLTISTDINDCKNKIDTDPIIIERLLDVLSAYVILGNPHYAKQYFVDEKYESLSSIMRNGFEYFVFAHEFGHLIAGHLDINNQTKYEIAGNETNTIVTNWQQEFEADFIGANILINVMGKQGYDISLSYWGIEIFFGCIDMVEKTLSILETGTVDLKNLSETHPPTLVRRTRIREIISRSFEDDRSKEVISLSEIVEEIINYLWKKAEPIIFDLKRNNFKASSHWQ
jgi:hypothetical protein